MNLIKLSEQLKEVPDNYLLQEVRAPQGAYPAYLIISELSRRKRMREGIAKPEPQTTVAEDLAGQSGGLAATPQAMQSTAGMDVNGQGDYEEQEMPEMAGGGLVAFQKGKLVDGDPFLDQLKEDRYIDQAGYQMSVPGEAEENPNLLAMLPGAMSDIKRYSGLQTPEQRSGIRATGESEYAGKVPFRREEEARRIAAKEQALTGERESNVNMALMEAGLGMMGSKAARGIQGIAEGGLKGLSALRAGKQEIKKSEAYLDDVKDRYARAQELYDEKKYAAGDKALADADRQQALGLAGAQARMQGISTGLGISHQEKMRPIEFEQKQRDLQLARDTYDAAVEAARLKPNDIRAQINLHNAQAEYYRAGGKGGAGSYKLASAGEIKTSREIATELLLQRQVNPNSPGYNDRVDSLASELLMQQGKIYFPMSPDAIVSGRKSAPGSPAGSLIPNKGGGFTYQPRGN